MLTSKTSKTKTMLAPVSVSADSLAISKKIAPQKLQVILTTDTQVAQRLVDEIHYFLPSVSILLFPDWETLPYDHFSPHVELVGARLNALWQIRQGLCDVVVVPINTVLTKLPPISYVMSRTFSLQVGQTLSSETFYQDLIASGYQKADQVLMPGEFAVRGGIIDLYPISSHLPYRLDLFDHQVEAIFQFDPESQKTLQKVNHLSLLPAREYPTDQKANQNFCQNYLTAFGEKAKDTLIYREVAKGLWPAGIEYYLPLFFEKMATLFDYVTPHTTFILHGDIHKEANRVWGDTQHFYETAQSDLSRPVLEPRLVYLSPNELASQLKTYSRLSIPTQNVLFPDVAVVSQHQKPLAKFIAFYEGFQGKVLIATESLGRRQALLSLLSQQGIFPDSLNNWAEFLGTQKKLSITVAPIFESFMDGHIAVITESSLYQHVGYLRLQKRHTKNATFSSEHALRDLAEIRIGDKVVHEEHGIGAYEGLKAIDVDGLKTEMMEIVYAASAKLYVPVTQLHLISRYVGQDSSEVPLHALGNTAWMKAKKRACEDARDTAADLLSLYAKRMAKQGHAFDYSKSDYEAFVSGFCFEETEDQAQAIDAVIQDMTSVKPMDRLICGDVGFGKTEVALRAAFIAAMGGRQVVFLAPTTLLVEQHYQTFCDRFANWPIRIAQFSRFRSQDAIQKSLLDLKAGAIDIAIGTHRLLQGDVIFKDLGLAIIDEEHRFGVNQKECLKKMRAHIDILTLTATPIPRTLSMALEGLRDFSMITTAPKKRLSIKTFVSAISDGVIQEAILRELKRGGQVFFLYNEVKRIQSMAEKLKKLVPQASLAIVHGQMKEQALERLMRDFLQQRYNILLCSTIIETGIDIPNANTIIIDRAERFGLAQLHQLRGRVGRSHHQAYAYLLVSEAIGNDAKRRLEAISISDQLGSGFFLAMQDLEIRGAGAILGKKQSGDIQAIGFSLYSAMLKRAVNLLKQGKLFDLEDSLQKQTDINLHSPAFLPESYCPDIHERLVIYKRLASAEKLEDIDRIEEEIIDRFGLLKDPVKVLIETNRIARVAESLGVTKMDASETAITVQFCKVPSIDFMKVVQFIQTQSHYRLLGAHKLKVDYPMPTFQDRIDKAKALLKLLAG